MQLGDGNILIKHKDKSICTHTAAILLISHKWGLNIFGEYCLYVLAEFIIILSLYVTLDRS